MDITKLKKGDKVHVDFLGLKQVNGVVCRIREAYTEQRDGYETVIKSTPFGSTHITRETGVKREVEVPYEAYIAFRRDEFDASRLGFMESHEYFMSELSAVALVVVDASRIEEDLMEGWADNLT